MDLSKADLYDKLKVHTNTETQLVNKMSEITTYGIGACKDIFETNRDLIIELIKYVLELEKMNYHYENIVNQLMKKCEEMEDK